MRVSGNDFLWATAQARHGNWWGVLDTLCHFLHAPEWIQRPVCNRYDRTLGAYDVSGTWTAGANPNVDISWTWKP